MQQVLQLNTQLLTAGRLICCCHRIAWALTALATVGLGGHQTWHTLGAGFDAGCVIECLVEVSQRAFCSSGIRSLCKEVTAPSMQAGAMCHMAHMVVTIPRLQSIRPWLPPAHSAQLRLSACCCLMYVCYATKAMQHILQMLQELTALCLLLIGWCTGAAC
jgi:hypothetical protein